MSAKYKSPSFLLPNEINTNTNPLNTDGDSSTGTGVNSLYSMDFGSNQGVNVSGTSLQFSGSTSFSAWFKMDGSVSTTARDIFSKGIEPTSSFIIRVQKLNNIYKIRFQIQVSGGAYISIWSSTSPTVTPDVWHHVVGVFDVANNQLKLYYDGTEVSGSPVSLSGATELQNTNDDLKIGIFQQNQYDFYGKIDEVAIFNRALDSTEINALYDGTGSNIRPSNLMATNLNPIAYYPLGEQAQMQGYLGNEASSEWQFPNGVLQDYVMDFDGTDYIDAGSSVGAIGTEVRTFSVWLKTSSNAIQTILGTRNINTDGWVIQWNGPNTGVLFYRPLGGGNNGIYSTTGNAANLTDGNWHHLVIVRAGTGNNKIYVDGVPQTLNAAFGDENLTDPQSSKNLLIGAGYTTGGALFRYFDGEMSNLAIWNSDQSTNIANIYNNGSPQTSYTVSPQNWWKLNADSVYTPSAPNYTKALSFDGASSTYITAGNNNSLSGPFTGYTISAWAKTPTSWESDYNAIFAKKYSFYFGLNTNHYLVLNPGSGTAFASYEVTSTTALNLDTWYHFLVTADGTNVKLYINGSLDKTQATTNTAQNSNTSNTPYIGGYDNAGDYDTWKGELSNIGFFNSALTSSQASTLFNFGTPETNISFNPVAWWKLDDQTAITDSSGNGNTGTNNGAVNSPGGVAVTPSWKIPSALPITTTPNYTTALDFVANGDTISIPDSNDLDLSGTDFSISFWVNANSINSSQMILQKYSGSTGWAIYNQAGSKNTLDFYQAGAFFGLDPNNDIENNVWSHYVVTANISASEYKVYKNGYLINTISRTVNITSSTQPLYIGSKDGTGFYYNGLLSNIAIYNSTLLPSQVSTIYNNGTPETAISFSPISWWKLDTGGSTITDYGSGGNNGTNNGASPVTSDVLTTQPVNGVSTTLPSTALQQSDLQFDSPYSNYSLSFDGTGDYIDCTDISYFSGADRFTLSTWFKVTDNPSTNTNRDIISKGSTTSGTTSFFIRKGKNTNLNKISVSFNEGTINVPGTTQLQNDIWYHLTVVYKGYESNNADRAKIYINGVDDTASYTNTVPTTLVSSTQPLRIGRWASGTDFFGKIDETAIWQSVLTDAQILQVYNNGRPSDIASLSPNYWWRLGENAYFNTGTTPGPEFTVPNSISGAPNGTGSGTITTMISADAPGTYANGIGTNLDILDRVGDAALSTSNSQSYNMIPSDISPYVPQYVGDQISNTYSMSFDGTNYFTASSKFDFIQQTAIFSISTWIKMSDNTSATNQVIAGTNYTGSNVGWQLWIDNRSSQSPAVNKTLKFHLWNSATNLLAIDQVITDNNWNLITITGDGTTIRAYKNGSLLSTTQSISGSTSSTAFSDLRIGANTVSSPSVFFNGQIDEVAIFDTALNAGQVYNDIYQPTSTATNQTADLVNNPNLPNPVAWYRMGD